MIMKHSVLNVGPCTAMCTLLCVDTIWHYAKLNGCCWLVGYINNQLIID